MVDSYTLTPHIGLRIPNAHGDYVEDWDTAIADPNYVTIDTAVGTLQGQIAPIVGQLTSNNLLLTRSPTASATIQLNNNAAPAGQQNRWIIYEDNNAEGSGNTASDLRINAYDNTGTFLSTPLTIIRGTGSATFGSTLTVSGALTVNGGTYCNTIFPAHNLASDWYLSVSGTYRLNNWATNWYDWWDAANGERGWNAPTGSIMTLDSGGNLNTIASVTTATLYATNINATNDIFGGVALYPCYHGSAGGNWYFTSDGNYHYQVHQGGGWQDLWRLSDGVRIWGTPAGFVMTLDYSGNLNLSGNISATGNINSSNSISATYNVTSGGGLFGATIYPASAALGNNYWLGRSGSSPFLNWASNNYDYWDGSYRRFVVNGNAFRMDGSGNFYIGGIGYDNGYIYWSNASDERIKTVKGEYTAGLDEVSKLRPVRYTYKGNDTDEAELGARRAPSPDDKPDTDLRTPHSGPAPYPNSPRYQVATEQKEFVGFVAQEIETIMPELVTKRAGFIDGVAVADIRDTNMTPLLFAMVNAIKELKAEIETLKARAP
jgi:hypothetical protein